MSYLVPKWVAALGQAEIDRLLAEGTLRVYGSTIVPVIGGADGTEDETPEPLFAPIPALRNDAGEIVQYDLSGYDDDALAELAASYDAAIKEVAASPADFVNAEYTAADLIKETKQAIVAKAAVKDELARRAVEAAAPVELSAEELDEFAKLAVEDEPVEEPEPVEEAPAEGDPEPVTASGEKPQLPAPSASRQIQEKPAPALKPVALTAAAGAPDMSPGDPFSDDYDIANAMIERRKRFGDSGPGTVEKFTIAKADWSDGYEADRRLGADMISNLETIKRATSPATIMAEFSRRKNAQANGAPDALVASGGLCAPVTPYYNLQFISVPDRPVMGALPSFNADRGGLRYARPAALSAVTTAVGLITESEDAAGGTSATKTCQVIPCPSFQETDVDIIYHCLQFGNLGARTFPELVAQWNNLVLAAHARLAEGNLLTQIDAFSTQVTAGDLGLGASASLFSQILTAAQGLRSRNRMSADAVLRILLPFWAPSLIVSDVIRTQFQRFDTDEAKVVALLRSFNIEPSFYLDSANGRAQVYGTQNAGSLLSFPADTVWYLFPEASFLYLDGGTLELGIVRDSVLNKTNDFQIFGETFENVAFVGVESLAVVSSVCDTGIVSAPATGPACPYIYGS